MQEQAAKEAAVAAAKEAYEANFADGTEDVLAAKELAEATAAALAKSRKVLMINDLVAWYIIQLLFMWLFSFKLLI